MRTIVCFLLAAALVGPAQADRLSHIATFEWPSQSFMGLSGLELSDDGATYHAISDRGWYLSGHLTRQGGVITDISIAHLLPILGNDGYPVSARRVGDWSDAEGLAMAADGTLWISFERWAHVSRFAGAGKTGEWIKDHPSFYDYPDNRQLEALALHPDGTLYTFPETPLAEGFPIYKLDSNRWEIVGHIPAQDRFAIVGADFDAQGQLYILERKFPLALWWQSRVRRLDITAPQSADILWTSRIGAYHNLEGIAVWADAQGPRLSMISDDNGNADEVTQIVEFRIEPDI